MAPVTTKTAINVPLLDLKAQYADLRTEIDGAVRRVMESTRFIGGPEVTGLEEEVARYSQTPHAVACASGTDALLVSLWALGVGPGDEVITSAYSFFASAGTISNNGATPVFVDIDPRTYNIDPVLLEAAITPRTRAVLPVHQMGLPCDLPAVLAVARRHGLPVVEDAACAVGSELLTDGRWQRVGRPHGDVACFSFHPRKLLTTGDGGMLTTNDAALDRQFRLLRQHGMSVPDTVRHGSPQVVFEDYLAVGYNYRMTDIQAAIGRKQLERLPQLVSRRRVLAARYEELLGNIEGLLLSLEPEWARSNWQSYCVRLPDRVGQKAVMQELLDQGIATRRGIMCSHREPCYAEERPRHDLRQSELAQDHAILLPLYAQMTEEDQVTVANALRSALHG